MNNASLIYNNSVFNIDNFINAILHKDDPITEVPLCEISEKPLFYFITIKNFYTHKYSFELYYKNKFLILRIKSKDNAKTIFTRIFYLDNIDIKEISHTYYNNTAKLKILKLPNF